MSETFINDVQTRLYGILGPEMLEDVMRQIMLAAEKYRIEPETQEMTVWQQRFPEAYQAYIVTRKIEGLSERSIELYRLYLEDFFRKVNKPLREISANDIRVYLYRVQEERGMSNRSLDSRRSAISAFFNWAAGNEYLDRNPCASVKPIKFEKKPREPLSATELERVRNACRDERERAIVEILYSTACRVSELAGLKMADVNTESGEVLLFGKGKKYRASYMSECALLHLKNYLAERNDSEKNLIVSERRPHKALSAEGIEKIVRDIGERAGVERLHPHLFRHSSATDLLQRGMDVTQLKALLGHSSIDTTMIYAKVDQNAVRENHRRFIS